METYSLEEDDVSAMFITQESWDIVPLIPNLEENTEKDVEITEMLDGKHEVNAQYSDISDDEVFEIPSSQKHSTNITKR